jgi:succinyl-CoA synthetase beta subunit
LEPVNIFKGPSKDQTKRLALALGLEKEAVEKAQLVFENLYKLFIETDSSQIEINPLVKTDKGESK